MEVDGERKLEPTHFLELDVKVMKVGFKPFLAPRWPNTPVCYFFTFILLLVMLYYLCSRCPKCVKS